MDVVERIKTKRDVGVVHCGYIQGELELGGVASTFSLSPDLCRYHKVSKAEALQILARLLHKDLAYGSKIMFKYSAKALSALFLKGFEEGKASFYTNINFSTEAQRLGPNTWAGPDWRSATDATFDAGVIAISSTRCACLWIEDED